MGANVTDVWETNLVGHPDENVWRFTEKDRRIILTHDDNFMNNRQYPIQRCHGVVVFLHKDGGEAPLVSKLRHFYDLMSGGAGFTYQTKIVINEDNTWKIYYIGEGGKIETSLYDLSDLNHAFELVDDS